MKIINVISHFLFFTGLFLKLFHIHFNAILMLIGLAGVVLSIIIAIFQKKERAVLLLSIANFVWLVLIFVSVKFLPVQKVVLVLAVVLTLGSIFLIVRATKIKMLLPFLISVSVGLFFYILPSHERYKLLSINWNYEISTDYLTWDKYSWFLYQNGEFTKALEASDKARNIAFQHNDMEWVEYIDVHHKAIKERNWTKYR